MHAAAYFFRGLKLITQPGLRRYVLLPLILNVLLFAAALWMTAGYVAGIIEWMIAKLPDWLAWLEWLLYVLFGIVALLLVFYSFSMVANIIAAPFNGYLAEAVYKKLAQQNPAITLPAQPKQNVAKQVTASIGNELKKLSYMLAWTLPLLLLFIIPVVNVIAPFVWFAFTARMLALEYLDYPMSLHGMTFSQQRDYLKAHKIKVFTFGSLVSGATMIPIVNFIVIPTAVAGATALWVEQLSEA